MTKPDFREENVLWQKGLEFVAGIDEVGRGCFAGPLVASAVILPQNFHHAEINDSKLLRAAKRRELADIIKARAVCYSIVEVPVRIIDREGIAGATQIAFYNAMRSLSVMPAFLLIDAFFIKRIDQKYQKAIIHGDRQSVSIASASILAKVYRDELMIQLHSKYPQYNFNENKGYGTKAHRNAIKSYGLSRVHRSSFSLTKYL